MRQFVAVCALLALACGGGDADGDSAPAVASASTAALPADHPPIDGAATQGAVHTVDMVITDQGEYRFIPDQLTIKAGDTVRWVNVSGGPHNVQFRTDGIPDGAAGVLSAAMQGRTIGELSGSLMTAPNAVYEISFEGAPAGEYDYTCTPHELLGMNAKMTVEN